jgi:hypothetical protein
VWRSNQRFADRTNRAAAVGLARWTLAWTMTGLCLFALYVTFKTVTTIARA